MPLPASVNLKRNQIEKKGEPKARLFAESQIYILE